MLPALNLFPATRKSNVEPFTIVFCPMVAVAFVTMTVPPPLRLRWPVMAFTPMTSPLLNVAVPPAPTFTHMRV